MKLKLVKIKTYLLVPSVRRPIPQMISELWLSVAPMMTCLTAILPLQLNKVCNLLSLRCQILQDAPRSAPYKQSIVNKNRWDSATWCKICQLSRTILHQTNNRPVIDPKTTRLSTLVASNLTNSRSSPTTWRDRSWSVTALELSFLMPLPQCRMSKPSFRIIWPLLPQKLAMKESSCPKRNVVLISNCSWNPWTRSSRRATMKQHASNNI